MTIPVRTLRNDCLDHVLRERTPYAELGPDYFSRQDPQRAAHRHVAQLERLGYRVALSPVTAA